MPIRCYITDYVAESLIANNYFNDTVDENWSNYFADKTIQSENLNNKIYIEGIIETNFNDFIDADLDDPNTFASFTDNKAFYNSLFFNSSIYVSAENANQFVSTNNIQYTYDDFIYSALNQNGIFNNIKLTSYGNTLSIIKGKNQKRKHQMMILNKLQFLQAYWKKFFIIQQMKYNLMKMVQWIMLY